MVFGIYRIRILLTLMTLLFSVMLVGNLFGQSGTSKINGIVTDQTGAVVPGATVTITNPATAFSRIVTTDINGNYSFPGLAPATYKMEVEATNFKKAVNNNVQALVDSTTSLNIALQPGTVSAAVEVTTATIESVVNTQDATIGNNFVSEQITQLPLNLRQVNDLLSLQPGVTRDGYVAGGRSDQANITLDGVDINDQQTGGRTLQFQTTQGSALRITTESVEEFRITIANANANQGRSSGAQISLVTRSGTNEFKGSAFYFIRPTAFSANDFFNNLAGIERPSLDRDVYGGRIGGPIWKDKFFFFYSYEGQQQELGRSVVREVPLSHMGNGELRFAGTGPTCVDGMCMLNTATFNGIFNHVLQNPAVVAMFADVVSKYPANDTNVGDGVNTGGFRFNDSRPTKENTHIARLDYKINDSQQLFLRGNYEWDNSSSERRFPDTPATPTWNHSNGFVVGHDWTISENKINNFRYGLTRQAFSFQGDSSDPGIAFFGVFTTKFYQRKLSRVTPVINITDDFIWIKGNHTMQFGGNVRIIRNRRSSFTHAFDSASTRSSFYDFEGGASVSNEIINAGYTIADDQIWGVQNAATALIGRFSYYSGNYTYDIDGSVLPTGTPTNRNFATEEYDVYGQDTWKPFRNLTITGGLRYALSRPVYEKNGLQIVPDERLGDYFDRRAASAAQGVPLNDLIQHQLGGPKNNAPGFYGMDWNNFQPRIAAAWSPDFRTGFWKALFGKEGDSTIRGGFSITNDYFSGQLAANFDELSSIGFISTTSIPVGTYNVTDRPAPLFTGFGQDIRSFPGISAAPLRFETPADGAFRLDVSLDATLVSPIHYTWVVAYGRSLPKEMYFEANYIGRAARNLFGNRDIMTLNNLVDPASGMDWYTAAGMLADLRLADTQTDQVQPIPYFENLFPNALNADVDDRSNDQWLAALPRLFCGAVTNTQVIYGLASRDCLNIIDWAFNQSIIDDLGIFPNMFYHPQYWAFSTYGTTAYSDYHGASFSLRQRLGHTLSYDINYTYSKSMDNASGHLSLLQPFSAQFILNPLRPDDSYSASDFDTKHVVNANFIFRLPVGKGRTWFRGMHAALDAVFGGWQLAGVYRWNTGQPISAPQDGTGAINRIRQSNGVRLRPVEFGVDRNTQNAFNDPQAAWNSFRNARPGETGDRNVFRVPGYQVLDLGLTKNFKMPWNENHVFQFRWEVFNVTNVQYFNDGNKGSTFRLGADPETQAAPSNFGRIYNFIQGKPRSMQFGFRYEF